MTRIWRILQARSSFAFRDLLNLARAVDAHARLDRIYEWYFVRTTTAIRVAYGAAVGAAAAIYGLVLKHDPMAPDEQVVPSEEALSRGLTAMAITCVIAGLFQRRELAQLHSEYAAASGLLAELRPASEPRVAPDRCLGQVPERLTRKSAESGWRSIVLAFAVVIGLIAAGLGVCYADTPERALTALVIVVPVLALAHIFAEWSGYTPFTWVSSEKAGLEDGAATAAGDAAQSTKDADRLWLELGDVLLETYVLRAEVANDLDAAIARAKRHAASA